MSKKRRFRRSTARNQREFSKPVIEYVLSDCYTGNRVKLWHPVRLLQLLQNGRAERTGPASARLKPMFALASSTLADNGEPQLFSMAADAIWPRNSGCATGSICDRLWLYAKAPIWNCDGGLMFVPDHADAALNARQELIEDETLLWGLPESQPWRLAEDWGTFGSVEYG